MGAFAGDVNNDGLPDLLLTEYGGVRLFQNLGGGKFRDVTREAGLDGADATVADPQPSHRSLDSFVQGHLLGRARHVVTFLFLRLGAAGLGAVVLAACGTQAPAAPAPSGGGGAAPAASNFDPAQCYRPFGGTTHCRRRPHRRCTVGCRR